MQKKSESWSGSPLISRSNCALHACGMDTRTKGHRALRRGRWSQAGQVYLLTAVTRDRQAIFASFESARAACNALHAFGDYGESALLAWVLMPDHVHVLLQLGPTERLPQAANRLKATTARNVNRARGSSSGVWARAFHDRALRAEHHLPAAARYIIANPVRAGIVQRVGDYPFWDCVYL